MGLTDKKSLLDRNIQGDNKEGPTVGKSLPSDGDYFNPYGNTDSPFDYDNAQGGGAYPSTDDHMVALLERRNVSSTNTDPLGPLGSSMVTNPMTYSPTPGGSGQSTLDDVPSLNNTQYGNGLFNESNHPVHGQGYKVNGEDLHIALLDQTVSNYHRNSDANYGAGQPGATWPSINPASTDLDGTTPNDYIFPT